jgi:hypothetical protein
VSEEDARLGALEVEPDLAPLAVLGMGPAVPLPPGVGAGDAVAVRIDAAADRRISVRTLASLERRHGDERAVLDAVAERLSRWRPDRPWVAPPVTHLGTVAASVAAVDRGVLREPGRPLSAVLREGGYEVHLGWVGPAGTDWESLTEEEIDCLEEDVAVLLAEERPAEAALVQERLLGLARRHLPERVPAARRLLARTLARAGRAADALATLAASFSEGDPEDRYEAALMAHRSGDDVSARRWVEEGLARAGSDHRSEVAVCLADIGADLDAQAAFLRLRSGLGGPGSGEDAAARAARAITGLGRSYLVEAMVEEVLAGLAPGELGSFLHALGAAGDAGREACLAVAAIVPPPLARLARDAAGRGARPYSEAVAGLVAARPAAAWATSPADAPDQQQIVVAVSKEGGRVSPLVVLVDIDDLGGGVKDAFFLPDMAEPRLHRELFSPMREMGLASAPVDLQDAISTVAEALARTAQIGWRIPSLEQQPVTERIERWLLRPRRGGAGRRRVAGS